ncbi:MAG TPA: T9SS type A sorting domain-containing protein [Bacteroidia bacterium]|nr:T9SS type A sorting domain-containing protein [Bacteroidia bacterium]
MKTKITLVALSFLFSVQTFSQAPNWQWAKAIGGIDWDEGYSIAIDVSGNVYTTGYFLETVDFDPGAGVFNLTSDGGSVDIFISKLSSSGNFVWAKAIGGTGNESGLSIAIDPAGSADIYITGFFTGIADFDPDTGTFNLTSVGNEDIFISKLDSSGNFVWAKAMGGIYDDVGYSLALDRGGSGDVYTTGWFTGTVDFDPGAGVYNLIADATTDIFISKLNGSGNFVWAKAIGGAAGDIYSYSIALDNSDNVYTTGDFWGTVDFDPGAATFNLTPTGIRDIFISKIDSSGNFVWAKAMGGTDYGKGNSIAPDASGNVYASGYFYGTVDFDPGAGVFNLTSAGYEDIFISKLDGTGNFVWAKAMGGTSSSARGMSIAIDASANVFTAGWFEGTVDFDPGAGVFDLSEIGLSDIFISKLNGSGNFVWAKAMGGIYDDVGYSITLDASGNAHVTGYFDSPSISFGSAIITNADTTGSTYDIFIAKLSNLITGTEHAENNNGISVYPNPATTQLIIDNGQLKIESVEIYDVLGEKVFSQAPGTKHHAPITIDVSGLKPGIYFVTVTDETGNKAVRKVVKM